MSADIVLNLLNKLGKKRYIVSLEFYRFTLKSHFWR